ncbi:toll/interleukin-1 receptor domain-containing protein [Variovorax robiniae]|uniref:Toll/interleukin-1 receptor domain-containing protein n=1 Tax=Variovorax robiniae TaxID=1836199 RepID=A0ABU8XKW8_9BURK
MSIGRTRTNRRIPIVPSIVFALFGHDFFISYAHSDGTLYPESLADALAAEPYRYRVHLDRRDYHIGDDLGLLTRFRVRNSQKLVVVAGAAALYRSRWVRAEVEAFAARGRNPIVIDPGGVVECALTGPAEPGTFHEWLSNHRDLLRHREAKGLQAPSQAAIRRLGDAFDGTRIEARRRRVVGAALALLAVLLIAAVAFGIAAEVQRRTAVEQRQRVERELSRADARQAMVYLQTGRDDAGAAFLARALNGHRSELAELVGQMLPEPGFVPTRRARLPTRMDAITRAWADPNGNYIAIEVATQPEVVHVFDWTGAEPRKVLELRVPAHDAVFTLISEPRPAAVSIAPRDPTRLFDAGSNGDRLVVFWLDAPASVPVEREITTGTGYESVMRLADGRLHYSRGPTLSAVRITATGIEVDEKPTNLIGHVNRISATPDGACLMLSDTSARFVIHYVDGREPVTWDSAPLWQGTGHQAQHAQGVLDPTCRFAALWSDGRSANLFLVHLQQDGSRIDARKIVEIEADPRDGIDFRNRFFTPDGKHLLVRNQGRWNSYETASGALLRSINVGQPDSSGALAGNDVLLASGFGDTVSYAMVSGPPGRDGLVSAGATPFVLPLRRAIGGELSFLTVSQDGMLTRFSASSRVDIEVLQDEAYLQLDASRRVLTGDGSFSARSVFFANGERYIVLQGTRGDRSEARLDCPRASDFDLVEEGDVLKLAAVTADGRLCIATVDRRTGSLSQSTIWPLGLPSPLDTLRTRDHQVLLIGDRRGARLYEVTLANGIAPRTRLIELADNESLTDVAVGSRGQWAALSAKRFSLFQNGRRVDTVLQWPCDTIAGLAIRRAMLRCLRSSVPSLVEVLADGTARPIALPNNVVAAGAALSPDGSTLVAPLRDGDGNTRQIYARLIDIGTVLTFSPRVMSQLLASPTVKPDSLNRLPRIEGLRYSPDGSRLYLHVQINFANRVLISNGPQQRYEPAAVAGRLGLSLASSGSEDELNYVTPRIESAERQPEPRARAAAAPDTAGTR